MPSLARADILRHITYSVTANIIRLSSSTSRDAGYLELLNPDATPLVPAFAIALRKELFRDAETLAHHLQTHVEIHACDTRRSWPVALIRAATSPSQILAHKLACKEIEEQVTRNNQPELCSEEPSS